MPQLSSCPTCGSGLVCPACRAAPPTPPADAEPISTADGELPSTIPQDPASGPPPLCADTPPRQVGRFVIEEVLGEGTFGVVYKARDPQLRRPVAVKVAKAVALAGENRISRFEREARAAANLHHPHIVPVYDSGWDGAVCFIAGAYVAGGTLQAELARAEGRPLDPRRVAEVVRKLADALGYAHQNDVVHRDVKPANVLLDEKGEPALADFGIAALTGDATVLTVAGEMLGTPAYMAPEQGRGRPGDTVPASDQYSLGVVFYELLTGRRPFTGNALELLRRHESEPPPPPRTLNPSVPRDLEKVCLKCLEKRPADRYPDCHHLAEDLRRWLDGEPVLARALGPTGRLVRWVRRKPAAALAVATGSAAVGLAVGLGVFFNLWRDADGERAKAVSAEGRARGEEAKALAAEGRAKAGAAKAVDQVNRFNYSRSISFAMLEYQSNNLARARPELDGCEPPLRGWEWLYVHRLCHADRVTLAGGHAGAVTHVAAAGPNQIITAGADGRVNLWDAATGALTRSLGTYAEVLGVSAVERLLAVAARDGTGAGVVALFGGPDLAATAVVRLDRNETARVQLTPTGAAALSTAEALPADLERRLRAAFTEVGRPPDFAVAVFNDPSATDVVLDAVGGTLAKTVALNAGPRGAPNRAQWLEIGRVGPAGGSIAAQTIVPRNLRLNAVAFDAEGELMALWSRETGRPAQAVTLYDRTGRKDTPLAANQGLFSGGGAARWEKTAGAIEDAGATAVGFMPGRRLAVGRADGRIGMFAAPAGAIQAEFRGHTGSVEAIATLPDGRSFVSGSADGTARVWGIAPKAEASKRKEAAPLKPTVSATLGDRAAEAGADGQVQVRVDGRELVLRGHLGPVTAVAFHPSGGRLVTGGNDTTVRVWELANGTETLVLKGHTRPVLAVRFSPNGVVLTATADDGEVLEWDAAPVNRAYLGTLPENRD